MALTSLHVQDVCYGGSWQAWNRNQICKYLAHETVGSKYVALCLKKAPGIIDEKRKNKQLPHDFDKMADNCPGYTYLKHIQQGYDI